MQPAAQHSGRCACMFSMNYGMQNCPRADCRNTITSYLDLNFYGGVIYATSIRSVVTSSNNSYYILQCSSREH